MESMIKHSLSVKAGSECKCSGHKEIRRFSLLLLDVGPGRFGASLVFQTVTHRGGSDVFVVDGFLLFIIYIFISR